MKLSVLLQTAQHHKNMKLLNLQCVKKGFTHCVFNTIISFRETECLQ